MITKEVEFLLKLRDALSMASEAVNEYIDTFAPKETVGITWNPENIKWEIAEGSSGPYERSEDVNSADFKELLKDLSAHNGKLTRNGLFYWVFQNGGEVGRKKDRWSKKA